MYELLYGIVTLTTPHGQILGRWVFVVDVTREGEGGYQCDLFFCGSAVSVDTTSWSLRTSTSTNSMESSVAEYMVAQKKTSLPPPPSLSDGFFFLGYPVVMLMFYRLSGKYDSSRGAISKAFKQSSTASLLSYSSYVPRTLGNGSQWFRYGEISAVALEERKSPNMDNAPLIHQLRKMICAQEQGYSAVDSVIYAI